ncbi:MAG: hypothetical protein AB1410_02945 [Acidobacteriota bacterium]
MKKILWISIVIFTSLFILWACREAPTLSKIEEEKDSPLFSDSLKASISSLEGRNQSQGPKNSNPDVVVLQTQTNTCDENQDTCWSTCEGSGGNTCYNTCGITCEGDTKCADTCLGETCRITCHSEPTCEGQLTCWDTCDGRSCTADPRVCQ